MLSDVFQTPIRVLVVVKAMAAGGLETYLLNVLSVIDRKKFKVTIACTGWYSDWYAAELKALGVEMVYCAASYSQIGYIWRLGKLIRKLDIDVVCAFQSDLSGPTHFVAKRAGVRNRISMYRSTKSGFRPDPLRNLYARLMHLITKCWSTRIIGNSAAVLDAYYSGWQGDNRFAVVNNGVDLNKFTPTVNGSVVRRKLGIPQDCTVIGHVGSFRVAKDHHTLLQCFANLKAQFDNVHLLLVGDGKFRSEIESLIEKLGIGDCVTVAGQTKNVPEMLAAMDIFFFPSLYEGMPNALIEAMASALPIVASSIPAIREIIPACLEKQLSPAGDVRGFTEALKSLCVDQTKRRALGCQARRHVEKNFSLAGSAENLCRYWEMDL